MREFCPTSEEEGESASLETPNICTTVSMMEGHSPQTGVFKDTKHLL